LRLKVGSRGITSEGDGLIEGDKLALIDGLSDGEMLALALAE